VSGNELRNELVWSHSRGRAFVECLRAYWFTYYGSWGGWETGAPAAVRQAYVEKKLTRRAMWTGTVVHGVAEEGLRLGRARGGDDVEDAVRFARWKAVTDITDSANGAWLERPARRTGFAEHYYGDAVDPAVWAAAIDEIERQVRNLHRSRIYTRLLEVPERIREVEELRRFPVGDAEVYVSLDVLVDDGRGGVVIIDWKTGDAHDDATIAAQLGVYGLYATQELGVPEDRIVAMHVNVRHEKEVRHPVGRAEIEAARQEIAHGVRAMRARLDDVAENLASFDRHPPLPAGDARCRGCNFRRSCGREGTPVAP